MSVSPSVAGPYFSSGSISFSALRNTFKQVSSGTIKASELKRNTTTSNTDPIVPDSTENAAVSSSTNLKLSQFRNTIKYYYMTQSGTDINLDFASQSWNSNLGKNIRKWLYINGTLGSNSVGSAAAYLNATVYNLLVDISGSIYGAGGSGGNAGSSGGSGGDAFSIYNSGSNLVVNVQSSAKIYGGGGGGGGGGRGSNGRDGLCIKTESFSGCGANYTPSCSAGFTELALDRGGCCLSETITTCIRYNKKGECKQTKSTTNCLRYNRTRRCEKRTVIAGGQGGDGGVGGPGRGYNYQSGSLGGSPGQSGTDPVAPGAEKSNIQYDWDTDGSDNSSGYLVITGTGSAKITLELETNDESSTNGSSYSRIVGFNGGSTGDPQMFSWGFQEFSTRSTTITVRPERYRVKAYDNLRPVQVSGGLKYRDSDGDDDNARLRVTNKRELAISSGETCGATSGEDGEGGASGGEWGSSGGGTSRGGGGGSAGRAFIGSNYSLTGSTNSSTIRG